MLNRGDFGIDTGRNIIHGSDSVESAQREIALWFKVGVGTAANSTCNCHIRQDKYTESLVAWLMSGEVPALPSHPCQQAFCVSALPNLAVAWAGAAAPSNAHYFTFTHYCHLHTK